MLLSDNSVIMSRMSFYLNFGCMACVIAALGVLYSYLNITECIGVFDMLYKP